MNSNYSDKSPASLEVLKRLQLLILNTQQLSVSPIKLLIKWITFNNLGFWASPLVMSVFLISRLFLEKSGKWTDRDRLLENWATTMFKISFLRLIVSLLISSYYLAP